MYVGNEPHIPNYHRLAAIKASTLSDLEFEPLCHSRSNPRSPLEIRYMTLYMLAMDHEPLTITV